MPKRPQPQKIERTFAQQVARLGISAVQGRGLVSVSGGADSTALLWLLSSIASQFELELEVLHFDHGLRPESAREAEHVGALAEGLKAPFHLRKGFAAPESGRGLQLAARQWRSAQSLALARERGARWIATGHQRDDHLETLLMKWLRGAHLSHLRGLRSVARWGWDDAGARQGGFWWRPLLPFRTETLRAYLRNKAQPWIEDPTNRDTRYTRNRLRHELMPLLNDLAQGALETRLDAMERQSLALADWLEAETGTFPAPGAGGFPGLGAGKGAEAEAEAGAGATGSDRCNLTVANLSTIDLPGAELPTTDLAKAPQLVRTHWIHRFLEAHGVGAVNFAVLEKAATLAIQRGVWRLNLPGGFLLRGDGSVLTVSRQRGGLEVRGESPTTFYRAGHEVSAPAGWTVRISRLDSWPFAGPVESAETSITQDAPCGGSGGEDSGGEDSGGGGSGNGEDGSGMVLHNIPPGVPILLRRRQPGDRFHPPGRDRPLKLGEFLRAHSIPSAERDELPLIWIGDRLAAIYFGLCVSGPNKTGFCGAGFYENGIHAAGEDVVVGGGHSLRVEVFIGAGDPPGQLPAGPLPEKPAGG